MWHNLGIKYLMWGNNVMNFAVLSRVTLSNKLIFSERGKIYK